MSDVARDSVYRLSKAVPAQLLGLLALSAGVVVVARLAAAGLGAPDGLLTVLQVLGVLLGVGALVAGSLVLRPPTVLRLTRDGFSVHWVRGAGVPAAPWGAVVGVTADERGLVVIRHRNGGVTYIPMAAVGSTPATIQSDIAQRLNSSRGYRRIG